MPTRLDNRGLTVTAGSDAEVAAITLFTDRLLRIERGLEAILENTRTFPETPMVPLLAARFCLFGQTVPADAGAAMFLAAAEPLLPAATDRERRLFDLLTRWHRKDHLGALAIAEDLTRQAPRDLLSAKFAEFFYYVLGQQHEAARFLGHMRRLRPHNADDADFLSMLSFAHELCGDTDDARAHGERAVELAANNAWAHHALAHMYLRRGDIRGGIARLEEFLPHWIGAARFIHCHNAWHLALTYLEDTNREKATELYRRHVGGLTPEYVTEQLDAIAFLWRMEMAGTRMDADWALFADRAEAQLDARYMPFLDAHYVYALTRAGRTDAVRQLLDGVRQRAAGADDEAQRSWAGTGQAVIEAAAAFAAGDARQAAERLDPVMGGVTIVGGSDAQVDLFRLTYFHALVGAGRKSDASAWWRSVMGVRPATELDRYRLGLTA